MRCTSCKTGELVPSFIEGQFRAHTCSHCGGNWILIEDYVAWKERNPEHAFEESALYEIDETSQAILCPVTGIIMRKLRLTAGNPHKIDYSASVGGVWLDKGEWELLKSEGLAGSLNAVLSAHWQRNIRINNTKDNFAEIYRDKFGQDSYLKAQEIRAWLDSQTNKADLRAYLLAADPYSAEQ